MNEANRYDWILFGLSKLIKTKYNFLLWPDTKLLKDRYRSADRGFEGPQCRSWNKLEQKKITQ